MKKITLFICSLFLAQFSFGQCDHTFVMIDSYGDGWNGASVDILVDNVAVVAGASAANAGVTTGSSEDLIFSASTGSVISLSNWVSGSYNEEISWAILDNEGTEIASGAYGDDTVSATGYCVPPPVCDHTFVMIDSYGDGWNGATVDISVNGEAPIVASAANAGVTTGSSEDLLFQAEEGSTITLSNWVSGSYNEEISWAILDGNGTELDSGAWGVTSQVIANCTPPTCSVPTDVTLSNITTTGLDISWTAPGGSETAFEFEVVPYGDPEPTSGASVSAAVTSVQETGLMAGTAYDVYVRSVCGGDYSAWSTAVSFYTACEVATGAFTNDFDTHNAGLVSDAACWAVENGGSANGWSTGDDGLGNTFWFINWDSTVAHDDALYSPAFSVVDGLTDGISFDSWNESASWTEIIDVEVWDDTLNNFLGYLAEDLAPPTDQTSYVYDLSAYEGQSVRIAFYIATLDLYRIYVDNFVVDSYAALGVEEASMAQFTYFPNPVNDVLTIKAQKAVEDITVFNMLGQVVKQQTPNTMDCTVDLSAMQSGAYFVQVSIDNTVETVRVLKK